MLLRGDQNGVGINASVESRATCDHGVRAAFEQCQLSDDRDQHRHAGRFSLAFDCGSAPEFNHCSVHVHSIDMKIHLTGHAAKSGLDHVHNPSGGGRAFGRSYDAIENYILVESQRDFVSHFGGLRCHRGSEDKMHRCALREDNFSGVVACAPADRAAAAACEFGAVPGGSIVYFPAVTKLRPVRGEMAMARSLVVELTLIGPVYR